MNLREFQKLRDDIARLRRDLDHEEGADGERRTRLRETFGCTSVADGERLAEQIEKELAQLEAQFTKKMKAFRKTHEEKINDEA